MNEDRNQQTTEVRETNEVQGDTNVRRQTVTSVRDADGRIVAQRVIWYVAGVIIAALAVRIVLLLLAANEGSPFVDFVYNLSNFFAWPFFGIFSYKPTYGQSVFEVSSLVAIAVYALVALGLAKLFTLTKRSDA
jgi:hypothetical protein